MRFTSYLPAALAVLATVDTLPRENAPFTNEPASSLKKRATIMGEQRRGPSEYKRSIASHMHAAYSKYDVAMPPKLASTLKGQAFNTPVDNDHFYTVPVTVGGQVLELNLDTGAPELWVWNRLLPQEDFVLSHNLYSPDFSNTSRKLAAIFGTEYGERGENYASGIVYTDNVFVGGIEAQNFPVGIATNLSWDIATRAMDGIIGMGMPGGDAIQPPITGGATFWSSIINDLEEPLFTVDLNRNRTGAYNFGFIDGSRFEGNISYLTVDPNSVYWTVKVSGFKIGIMSYSYAFKCFIDTGATFTKLPPPLLYMYFTQVPGAIAYYKAHDVYAYNCASKLPALSFEFAEGYVATIDPSYITYAEIKPGLCMSGFQPMPSTAGSGGAYVLGDTFIVSQFVVFNTQPVLQVGLASKALDGLNAARRPRGRLAINRV